MTLVLFLKVFGALETPIIENWGYSAPQLSKSQLPIITAGSTGQQVNYSPALSPFADHYRYAKGVVVLPSKTGHLI
jgi:hypothetical protein